MIRHWVVLDLDVFRRCENGWGIRREYQDNRDGTYFIAYDIRSFPDDLIVAKSDTMALALERGVSAVERLPSKYLAELDERCRQRMANAPELQTLIQRHGGYSNVPPEAWAEWDQLNVAWQTRRYGND